jgi:hypothetical protein
VTEYLYSLFSYLFIYLFTLEFWQKFATKRTLAGWSVLCKYGEFGISSLIMWRNSFALFLPQIITIIIIIIVIYHFHLHFFFWVATNCCPASFVPSLPPSRPLVPTTAPASSPTTAPASSPACVIKCTSPRHVLALFFISSHIALRRPASSWAALLLFAFQIPTSCMIQLFDSLLYIFFFLS